MFYGCTSLNYIKAMFTTDPFDAESATEPIGFWVNDVASSGTFVKNSAATWENPSPEDYPDFFIIPEGWTVQTASA
jgi:hypothetical protein